MAEQAVPPPEPSRVQSLERSPERKRPNVVWRPARRATQAPTGVPWARRPPSSGCPEARLSSLHRRAPQGAPPQRVPPQGMPPRADPRSPARQPQAARPPARTGALPAARCRPIPRGAARRTAMHGPQEGDAPGARSCSFPREVSLAHEASAPACVARGEVIQARKVTDHPTARKPRATCAGPRSCGSGRARATNDRGTAAVRPPAPAGRHSPAPDDGSRCR